MGMLQHAINELAIHEKQIPEDDKSLILPYKEEILAIVEKFSKAGHSGGSSPYGARAITEAIERFLNQRAICPLTGEDDEWFHHEDEGDVYQNKRDGAVFKIGKDGQAYYLDAVVWRTQNDTTWTGKTEAEYSRQYIKSFPFTPKTFIVDVIETEVAPDDWEFAIKDPAQLEEVFQYYDRYQ